MCVIFRLNYVSVQKSEECKNTIIILYNQAIELVCALEQCFTKAVFTQAVQFRFLFILAIKWYFDQSYPLAINSEKPQNWAACVNAALAF